MVEILSGTTAARSVAQSSPDKFAASSSASTNAAIQAVQSDFYLSPVIRFDSESLRVIFEVRDSSSGEVTRQFPPERVVRELQRSASLGVAEPAQSEEQAPRAETVGATEGDSAAESGGSQDIEQEVNVLI